MAARVPFRMPNGFFLVVLCVQSIVCMAALHDNAAAITLTTLEQTISGRDSAATALAQAPFARTFASFNGGVDVGGLHGNATAVDLELGVTATRIQRLGVAPSFSMLWTLRGDDAATNWTLGPSLKLEFPALGKNKIARRIHGFGRTAFAEQHIEGSSSATVGIFGLGISCYLGPLGAQKKSAVDLEFAWKFADRSVFPDGNAFSKHDTAIKYGLKVYM